MTVIAVAVLAAVAAVTRGAIAVAANQGRFPLGTLAVNLVGAFAMGVANTLDGTAADAVRVGLLGTLTTWSTLAAETVDLSREGHHLDAAAYLGGTVVAGIGLAFLGLRLAG